MLLTLHGWKDDCWIYIFWFSFHFILSCNSWYNSGFFTYIVCIFISNANRWEYWYIKLFIQNELIWVCECIMNIITSHLHFCTYVTWLGSAHYNNCYLPPNDNVIYNVEKQRLSPFSPSKWSMCLLIVITFIKVVS